MTQTEITVKIDASPRGCGRLKKGGVYAGGGMAAGGALSPMIPLLMPTMFEVAPRRLLSYTAADFNTWILFYDQKAPPIPIPHSHVLVSHVGKAHYSPSTFMYELRTQGPSRRISPDDIPDAAKLPIPIIFTHDHAGVSNLDGDTLMPWMKDPDAVGRLSQDETELFREDFDYVWEREGFTWGSEANYTHPMMGVYDLLDELRERRMHKKFFVKHKLFYEPGVFCGSWITYVFWVPESDDQAMPDNLREKGVYRAELFDGEAE